MMTELNELPSRLSDRERADLTGDIRMLKRRLEMELPPLLSELERAETERASANAAATKARRRAAGARQAVAALDDTIQGEIRKREALLTASADPTIEVFREELVEGWQRASDQKDSYVGIRFRDATLEGKRLLAQAFVRAIARVSGLKLDGECTDVHAAITRIRTELVEECWQIAQVHAQETLAAEGQPRRDAVMREKLLEADLQFRARGGWPDYALEAYRTTHLASCT